MPQRTFPDPAPRHEGLSATSVARYMEGAPAESDQFEFLIGDWDCDVRLPTPGSVEPTRLHGKWHATWTHGRRMVVDDLTVLLPTGEEVVGWVSLRTWCADLGCWQIMGQRALEPATGTITTGHWQAGEMQLLFETENDGAAVEHEVLFSDITEESFEWRWIQKAGQGDFRPFVEITARRATAIADGGELTS